jgi:hypothetical protein
MKKRDRTIPFAVLSRNKEFKFFWARSVDESFWEAFKFSLGFARDDENACSLLLVDSLGAWLVEALESCSRTP